MGPKSYAVREASGKAETKMKGFTLHHENATKVNLTAMKKLIDGEVKAITGNHLNFIKKTVRFIRESRRRLPCSLIPSGT